MANDRDRVIPISHEDVQKALKLEEMIEARIGTRVIRSEQRPGVSLETVDYPVRGVLIHKKSAQGAVRFFGKDKDDEVVNVVTGPQEQGCTLIWMEEGEYCRIYGTPTIQLFQEG